MEQFIEFIGNHPVLVSAFIILFIALVVTESKRGGHTVSPQQASLLINREQAVVFDIRDRNDYLNGHIVDAISVPYNTINDRISELSRHKDKPVILTCKMGQHSGMIGKKLKEAGFDRIYRLAGGISEWQSANFPLVTRKSAKSESAKTKKKKARA